MQAKRRKRRAKKMRNVASVRTTVHNVRVDKFRALLPLGPGQGQHSVGTFDTEEVPHSFFLKYKSMACCPCVQGYNGIHDMQEAGRAADRAALAFYGRGHPAAQTNFPAESYQACMRAPWLNA